MSGYSGWAVRSMATALRLVGLVFMLLALAVASAVALALFLPMLAWRAITYAARIS